LDVLCFGEAIIDFFPAEGFGHLSEVETFRRHLGGAPTNVAVGLARQGTRVGLETIVGNDDFGRFLRAQLAQEGIDCTAVHVHPAARTGIAFVAVERSGQRSFTFYRTDTADQLLDGSMIDPEAAARARLFHFGATTLGTEPMRSATLRALELAERAGCTISFDPNWREHLWGAPSKGVALIRELVARAHIVKLSDDELPTLLGLSDPQAAAARLVELGCTLAVITVGARGCLWHRADGLRGTSPGVEVAMVDSTGAGDAFVAGLLASLSRALCPLANGSPGAALCSLPTAAMDEAMRSANALGASACTAVGATTAIPRASGSR
jgi:fructokinase